MIIVNSLNALMNTLNLVLSLKFFVLDLLLAQSIWVNLKYDKLIKKLADSSLITYIINTEINIIIND